MQASDRQIAIYNHWEVTDDNILVEAVAGSGKTTTLIEILKLCQYKTLFLAFNKSIQTDINAKIEELGLTQGKSMTMHSLGLQAIRSCTRFKINNNKKYDIIKKVQTEFDDIYKRYSWEDKMKLSYTLMDLIDTSKLFLTDDLVKLTSHMSDMDKTFYDQIVTDINGIESSFIETVWNKVLEFRDWYYQQPVVEIDFNDMIYLPVIKRMTIPVNPYYLMVDEAQDLNLVQHKLINMLINQSDIHKFIAVGDRNQSIYGFSGAYASSFDLFKEYPNTVEFPLDICYRCPTAIIEEANKVYDVMQANKTYTGTVGVIEDYKLIKDDSMIICRNSAPLFDVYFKLLGEGKKVMLKGEDILGTIMTFLKPFQYKTVNQARIKIEREIGKLAQRLDDDKNKFKFHKMKENLEIFNIIVTNMCTENTKVGDLLDAIKKIFANDEDATIVLCTIHKSKGLQADIVYILNENLIPSKFAKSKKQLKQEINLKYVARTRAKEELYYLNL